MAKSVASEHLSVSFTQKDSVLGVIADLTLSVQPGEFLSIIGPSGCGKSTFLNTICGQVAYSGKLEVDHSPVGTIPPPDVGYLFQRDHFLPWRTVIDNVVMPLEFRNVPAKERYDKAEAALAKVGLAKFKHFLPPQLSGGMLKRAALAQLLAYSPELLLMDEAFGSLDLQTRTLLEDQFYSLWLEQRPTVIFVTHDPAEAVSLGQRVVVFSARPARLMREYCVGLPIKRNVSDVRFSADVRNLEAQIWNDLRGEVSLD